MRSIRQMARNQYRRGMARVAYGGWRDGVGQHTLGNSVTLRTLRVMGTLAVAGLLAALPGRTHAGTSYWNRFDAPARVFNEAGNWVGGVPGPLDTAAFTNWGNNFTLVWSTPTVNKDAFFDAVSLTREARPGGTGSAPWTVTNSLVIGNSSANTATMVVYNQQIIAVTNSSGTATLRVNWGTAGRGRLSLYHNQAQVIADHLYATNYFASRGFDGIDRGTLVTKGESTLATLSGGGAFYIGNWRGALGTWRILGGTNTVWQDLHVGGAGVYGDTGTLAGTGVVEVEGPTAFLAVRNLCNVGGGTAGTGRIIVTNGATAKLFSTAYLGGAGVGGNQVLVTGTNSLLDTRGQVYLRSSTPNNVVRVENGGTWKHNAASAIYFNKAGSSTNNAVVIDGPGSSFSNWYDMYIGGGGGEQHGKGWLIVRNGGTASSTRWASVIEVGYGTGNTYGEIRVEGAGSTFLPLGADLFNVGVNGTGAVYVVDGGLMQRNTIRVGANGKGLVMNNGGILQFTTVTPTIRVDTPGRLVVTNGTISFRNLTTVNVKGNVSGTQLTNATFYGANAFRLNNATNTTTGQTYVFDVTGDPRNYARLEMVGGGTRYRGAAGDRLTIGSGGAMLVSNTAAIVDLVFTNNGTMTITKSTLKLNQPATLRGTLRIDLDNLASSSGVLAAGNLTLGPSSTLAFDGTPPEDGATLCTYSGTRSGTFASVAGLPATYAVRYEPTSINLVRLRGTTILLR